MKQLWIMMASVAGVLLPVAASANEQPYCREYTQTVSVAGGIQRGYGTACLQPDGAWKIVSQQTVEEPAAENYSAYNEPAYVDEDAGYYPVQEEMVYAAPAPQIVFMGGHHGYRHYHHRW